MMRGYLAFIQTPDGIIQLISSLFHYRFNLSRLLLPAGKLNEQRK
jgi:hypothetical protein